MNKEKPDVIRKPTSRRGWLIIGLVAALLLAVSIFESLRYFKPVTAFRTGAALEEETLPDGSGVLLNQRSRLTLSDEWKTAEHREAWLEGEGFFTTVRTDDTNGVTIHTPRFDVVAFQAKFNLFNRNNTIRAWLQEGEAYILSHDAKPKKVLFEPGDLVEYRKRQFIIRKDSGQGIIKWTSKK